MVKTILQGGPLQRGQITLERLTREYSKAFDFAFIDTDHQQRFAYLAYELTLMGWMGLRSALGNH